MKRVVVLGASPNPNRYAYKAATRLKAQGYEIILLGRKEGEIAEEPIFVTQPKIKMVHTITMYIRPEHQVAMYDYILSLKPKRIIFNPGTENPELAALATKAKIKVENACTLVLLSTNSF